MGACLITDLAETKKYIHIQIRVGQILWNLIDVTKKSSRRIIIACLDNDDDHFTNKLDFFPRKYDEKFSL